jgi:hypothetical protein
MRKFFVDRIIAGSPIKTHAYQGSALQKVFSDLADGKRPG